MPVYHIVLFRLKPNVPTSQLETFVKEANSLIGKIPGLTKIDVAPPLLLTAHRAKGFDFGLVAVLEKPEDVQVYGAHDAHLIAHKLREAISEDTLAYDMEF